MSDPQQTTPIPKDNQQAVQEVSQETDFFGWGEDAFENGKVIDPNNPSEDIVAKPEQESREPTLPMDDEKPIDTIIPWEEESASEKDESIAQIPPYQEAVDPVSVQENETDEEAVEEIPAYTQEENAPETNTQQSDLTQKFLEMFRLVKQVEELKWGEESFDVIGGNNEKSQIFYKFFAGDEEYPLVSVTKKEIDKIENEETVHELSFYLNEGASALMVNLDEELLFDEDIDLKDDVKKKMQVLEKINKFIFLVTEEAKKIEKEKKEKEAEMEEKRKLQDVFRNF